MQYPTTAMMSDSTKMLGKTDVFGTTGRGKLQERGGEGVKVIPDFFKQPFSPGGQHPDGVHPVSAGKVEVEGEDRANHHHHQLYGKREAAVLGQLGLKEGNKEKG